MPHNLYLHSGIIQTRAYGGTMPEKKEALKFATIDSTVALMFALTINASLLILAAATFNRSGQVVACFGVAHSLLLLGSAIAPVLFGVALLCCGLNSTVTATMAGQIVMEGFIDIRMAAWARRLFTRLVAIVPALVVIFVAGEAQLGKLLVLSQVVLGLQLPFAVVPLVMFTASKTKLGALVAPRWLTGDRGGDRRGGDRAQCEADLRLRRGVVLSPRWLRSRACRRRRANRFTALPPVRHGVSAALTLSTALSDPARAADFQLNAKAPL